jgi:hypothetical protein
MVILMMTTMISMKLDDVCTMVKIRVQNIFLIFGNVCEISLLRLGSAGWLAEPGEMLLPTEAFPQPNHLLPT